MMYDLAAFAGRWPFRRLENDGPTPGFHGGFLSSLDAIFYNDPREGDEPLFDALDGSGWQLAACADPGLPWTPMAVEAWRARGVRAIRLYPCIHPFGQEDLAPVLDAAAGMTVIVTARMEDPRLCRLLEQRPVDPKEWAIIAQEHPKTQFLLSNFYLQELLSLGEVPANLWTDTAGLCHGLDPVAELVKGFPESRIVFGSLFPLQAWQSHLLNVPVEWKNAILLENPRKLLEVADD